MLHTLGGSNACGPVVKGSKSPVIAQRARGVIPHPHTCRQAQRSAQPHCQQLIVSCQVASSAPAAGATTALGSPAWEEFAAAASGEWSGMAVTYGPDGQAQELPYQYVPSAFREWDQVPKDWHTQCSSLADSGGLLMKLKRLMPIVGCEADAVAFTEDEQRALRSEPRLQHEPKTVLQDGSYSTGPRTLGDLTRARVEHCLVRDDGHRMRLVFNLKRFETAEPWALESIEQHGEQRDSDYTNGQSLAACGYSMTNLTDKPQTAAADLSGNWAVTSHAAFELNGENGFRDSSAPTPDRLEISEDAILLHGGAWCVVSAGAGGTLMLQAGWLVGEGESTAATRTFADERLTAMAFTSAKREA